MSTRTLLPGFTLAGLGLAWVIAGLTTPTLFAQSPSLTPTELTLTNAAQIRQLPPAEAARGLAVQLNAVVTYSDIDAGLLFVHDDTGGIFITPAQPTSLPPGTLVALTGFAQPGSHLPFVAKAVLLERGLTNLPPARPVSFEDLATGREDSNWIQTEGVVRSAQIGPNLIRLVLSAAGRRIVVRVAEVGEWTRDTASLIDAEVRVRAVAGALATSSTDSPILDLHVPHPRYLDVRRRGTPALQAPLRTTAWLRHEFPTNPLVHRIRIRGSLKLEPGLPLRLHDDSGSVRLLTAALPSIPTTNATVEIAGFPAGNASDPAIEDLTVALLVRSRTPDLATPTPPAPLADEDFLPVLTEIAQIRSLNPQEADRGYPVRVRGVITFSHLLDNGGYVLFVQDATAGIYVRDPTPDPANFPAGRIVELEGTSDPGEFAPIVLKNRLTILGEGPMPQARMTPIEELLSGRKDSQRVRLQGIVTRVSTNAITCRLGLLAGRALVEVVLPADPALRDVERLVDAEVRVTGVCGSAFNRKRQLTGLSLFVRRPQDIIVVHPAPADHTALPTRTIRSLSQFDLSQESSHRVRVPGIVSLPVPGLGVFLQDESDGLFVATQDPNTLRGGDRVEVVGFPLPEGPRLSLLEAQFHRLASEQEPPPQAVTPETLSSGDFDNRLVVLDATLLEKRGASNQTALICRSRQWAVEAYLPAPSQTIRAVAVGSHLRLTGVWAVHEAPPTALRTARLLLRSPSDLVVLERPSWWNPRHTLATGGGLLTLIALALTYVLLLRRQVAERTEQIQKLHAQLLQAQKIESIGRLAGGVAHDFNNMLQTILGNAALALEEHPNPGPLREHLDEIQKAARRSADLTRQLLAFARKQTVHPRTLDLNDTIAGLLKMLRRLLRENIQLLWHPGPALWPVRIDPSQLDQVLANLAVNARDAIPNAGQITIETANVSLDPSTALSIPETTPGDYVQLTVRDSGAGMAPEILDHLFEPFFTTKPVGQGTGLGLATVYGIVKQNGGAIRVQSLPGQGTTFTILFPRSPAPSEPQPAQEPPHPPRGSETILLVEDEPMVLQIAQRVLTQQGYTVLAAGLPTDALRLAQTHPGPLHLLITDVIMPGMNGPELRRQLAHHYPQLRCLFISGYTADTIAPEGVLDAAVHLLTKPFTIDQLTRKTREVLDTPTPPRSGSNDQGPNPRLEARLSQDGTAKS